MNIRQLNQLDPYLTPQTKTVYLKQMSKTLTLNQTNFFNSKQLSQNINISRSTSAQQMFYKTQHRGYDVESHVKQSQPLYFNYRVIDRQIPFVKMHFNGGAYVDRYPEKKPIIESTGVRAQRQRLEALSIKRLK
ncbi:hypothetical protein SS50377_25117 [Spironucleus salmonicida]|uniref:Uncharacterized protein n=1 Tax=Spironucleus salmonicida TaxID=348837 RepID=V6LV90_9EUKA|nr:hypothetical protein SS50377_25117 [Spironucleus salmonicida]|eukprot:EST44699.1 Hypothetical protein SS50377_15411 [Spironucleus salmonicida]